MKNLLFVLLFILPLILSAQNLLDNPESIAYDAESGRYLVSNCGDGKIIAVAADGTQTDFFTGLGVCLGNLLHNNILYVSVQEYAGVPSGNAVVGIDITTQQLVMTVEFGETNTMDGMAVDSDGMIYIIDTTGRLFQLNPETQTQEIVVNAGLGGAPQDCYYDEANDRLITVNFAGGNSYIRGIDLDDFSITTLLNPTFGNFDGVTLDQYGNIYVASYDNGGCIYRIDDSFEYDPELRSTGHTGPAGIDFNREENILAVPNFYTSVMDLIEVDFEIVADFSVSISSGTAPLEVQFFDETIGNSMVWWWDFEDDGTTDSVEQNPIWTYTENGVYTVKLKVHNGLAEDIEIKTAYIVVEEADAENSTFLPEIVLEQNIPNPFNPETVIRFQLSSEISWSNIELDIFNSKGQKIREIPISPTNDNTFAVTWNGKNNKQISVPSGIYYYQLKTDGVIRGSKKCLLLK